MRITAFIPVYNEEKRIKYALQSLRWCDEIVLLDKTSDDDTVKIAKEFGAVVYIVPNTRSYSASEFDYLKKCTGDWIFIFTASDIIDISLAQRIREVAKTASEDVSYISFPIERYILGIGKKSSPWNSKKAVVRMFRRTSYKINASDVHGALTILGNNHIDIGWEYGCVHHLTHESVDMMLDRHVRYWRKEGDSYSEKSLVAAFKPFLQSIKQILKRRTFFGGWDGVALSFAYLTYAMFSFLYKWEKYRQGKAARIYKELRMNNYDEWRNYYND